MQKSKNSTDNTLLGADAALRRAAINAKKLAEQQGVPYVIYKVPSKQSSSRIVEKKA